MNVWGDERRGDECRTIIYSADDYVAHLQMLIYSADADVAHLLMLIMMIM